MTRPLPDELTALVAEQASHGLIVLDGQERIALWNHWVSQRSNIDSSQALGSTLEEIFPTALDPRIQRATRAALKSGTSSIVASVFHRSPLPLQSLGHGGGALDLRHDPTPPGR